MNNQKKQGDLNQDTFPEVVVWDQLWKKKGDFPSSSMLYATARTLMLEKYPPFIETLALLEAKLSGSDLNRRIFDSAENLVKAFEKAWGVNLAKRSGKMTFQSWPILDALVEKNQLRMPLVFQKKNQLAQEQIIEVYLDLTQGEDRLISSLKALRKKHVQSRGLLKAEAKRKLVPSIPAIRTGFKPEESDLENLVLFCEWIPTSEARKRAKKRRYRNDDAFNARRRDIISFIDPMDQSKDWQKIKGQRGNPSEKTRADRQKKAEVAITNSDLALKIMSKDI